MKNSREIASIHPCNKYLLCSFEGASTIQGIGTVKWTRSSPWSQVQGFVGRQTLNSLNHLQHNVINIMMKRFIRCNRSLYYVIIECCQEIITSVIRLTNSSQLAWDFLFLPLIVTCPGQSGMVGYPTWDPNPPKKKINFTLLEKDQAYSQEHKGSEWPYQTEDSVVDGKLMSPMALPETNEDWPDTFTELLHGFPGLWLESSV